MSARSNSLRVDLLDRNLGRVERVPHRVFVVPQDLDVLRTPLLATLPAEGSTVLNGLQVQQLAAELSAIGPVVDDRSAEVSAWVLEAIRQGLASYVLFSGM